MNQHLKRWRRENRGDKIYRASSSSLHFSEFLISQRGQSLLLTLIVLAAMVILFTILGRVVLIEKRVTRGYSEILRSDMAAKAGASDAESLLLQLFSNYPDSATYWEPNIADANTALPGTVFMYRDLPPDQVFTTGKANAIPTPAPTIFARPLVSGSRTQEFYPVNNFDQTLPDPTNPANTINLSDSTLAIDLNAPSTFDSKDPNGWIGALPGQVPTPTPVPWVQILADPTKAKDLSIDPLTHQPKNPVVARYAYWIDDESFKINVNTVQAGPRGLANAEVKTENVQGVSQVLGNPMPSLQGLFDSSVLNISDAADAIVSARNALAVTGGRFLSPYQVGHSAVMPTGETGATFGRDYKFLMTTSSTGLNLSRSGFKRLNLNDLVARSGAVSKTSPGTASGIQQAVGQIVAGINSNAPHFGQRFYRIGSTLQMSTSNPTVPNRNLLSVGTTVTAPAIFSDETAYVEKLGANIFDYISPSVNPTVLDKNGNVLIGSAIYSLNDPKIGFNLTIEKQANPLLAIGKKAVPYFTEYMMHAKIVGYTAISPTSGTANFQLEIDHYFEFWNMTNKDIVPANGDLGSNPYFVLENQPTVSMNNQGKDKSQDIPQGRPFEIKLNDIAGLTFPADSFTVITTDPNWKTNGKNLGIVGSNVYVATKFYLPPTGAEIDSGISTVPFSPPANIREYACTTAYANNGNEPEAQMGPSWASNIWNSSPAVIMGNDSGLFNVTAGLNLGTPKTNLIPFHGDESGGINPSENYFRGSYVSGLHSENCDPRASFEALTVDTGTSKVPNFGSGCNAGAYSSDNNDTIMTGSKTLGTFATEVLVGSNLGFWPSDIAPASQGTTSQIAANAPMVIAQGPMMAIGELGNVYDPIRYDSSYTPTTTNSSAVVTDRGGGRTLTIGQPDIIWDGTRIATTTASEMSFQTSASRNWAAWRLADIFTVKEDADMAGSAKTEIGGLYNPNGILRDQGQALQSLLQGIAFANGPDSDPALQGSTLNTTNTTTIVKGTASSMSIPSATAGGQAMASYLAGRLARGTAAKPATFFSPIWEPGELSQLYLFNTADTIAQIVAGTKASQLNDRGHEELCRRLMDLITPKGNTFSIYVVGQSLNQQGNVMSTKAERVTVRLRPIFNTALIDSFDPTDATATAARFRKPDSYILEVIQVEDAS